MARRLIILFWAMLLLGCSSLSQIHVVSESSAPIKVETEFISARKGDKPRPKVTASLAPGESMAAVENIFSPRGELVVLIDGKRTERFPINGSSSGGTIWCRVGGAGVPPAAATVGGLNATVRAGIVTCIGIPVAALLLALILRLRKGKTPKIALP